MELIVKNNKTPLLIRNTLKWELLKWDLNKWKRILGNKKLVFRCGQNGITTEPQFENVTSIVKMTFEEFLNVSTETEWFYFDYKYLKDWFLTCHELRKQICWKDFGFPELNVEDSTIWIGSTGAHTPCHIDSYGCNIIAQIYGRKRWILFPPEEDLQSTRIPYEESTIFSKINFFAPSDANLAGVKNCYSIILNPGDVLVVPHKWWHYVENLEFAISINTWIKLPVDFEERVKEAIVRMKFISHLKELQQPDVLKELLTVNIEPDMFEETSFESFSVIFECLKQFEEHKKALPQNDSNVLNVGEMLEHFPNIEEILPLSKEDFQRLLENQGSRWVDAKYDTKCSEIPTNELRDFKKLLDAVVHSDVIDFIYKKISK